jgi:hypothetical protein
MTTTTPATPVSFVDLTAAMQREINDQKEFFLAVDPGDLVAWEQGANWAVVKLLNVLKARRVIDFK